MALGGSTSGGGIARAIEAGRAFVRVFAKDDLTGQLKGIASKFNAVGTSLMKGGGTLAAPLIAAIPFLVGAFDRLGELSRMDKVAKAFGITGEAATGLLGVLRSIGSETKEDIEGLTQFSQKVQDAAGGNMDGEAGKLFKGLSVKPADIAKLPLDEQFYKVLGAIRELPQSMQLFKLSMLGGTDSMKKWIPLLSMSEAEVRRLAKTMAVSQQELNSASRAMGAVALASALFSRSWDLIAVGVAPVVEYLAKQIAKLLIPVNEWLKQNRELVGIVVAVVAAVGAVGLALIAAGAAIKLLVYLVPLAMSGLKLLVTGFGLVTKAVALLGAVTSAVLPIILTPWGLLAVAVTAALAGIGYWFLTQTDMGRAWAESITSYFTAAWQTIKDTWGGVVDALRAGDLELAWKIVVAGLEVAWLRFWGVIKSAARDGWNFFADGWDSALYVVRNLWVEFVAGFKGLWVDAVAFMGKHFGLEITAILNKMALIPGLDKMALGLGAALNVVTTNPAAVKAEINKERDAKLKGIQDEFETQKMLRGVILGVGKENDERELNFARERLDVLRAKAAAAAAAADNDNGMKDAVNKMASAAGMFSAPNGLLAQAFGLRSINPQVLEQKKTNAKLDTIIDVIVKKGPLTFT